LYFRFGIVSERLYFRFGIVDITSYNKCLTTIT